MRVSARIFSSIAIILACASCRTSEQFFFGSSLTASSSRISANEKPSSCARFEPDAADAVRRVGAVAGGRPRRRCQKALSLVVADRLEIDSAMLSKFTRP